MTFRENLIQKWEKHYAMQHKGFVKLDNQTSIVYWDNGFVENVLSYAETLYQRAKIAEDSLKKLLEEIKDGTDDYANNSDVGAKIAINNIHTSGMVDTVSNAVDTDNEDNSKSDKEEEVVEEIRSDAKTKRIPNLQRGGKSFP